MSQPTEMSGQPEFDSKVTTCANCRTPMPLGLRFCRNCGFRLGEGPAEYTETTRFPGGQAGAAFGANYAAPLAQSPAGAFGKKRKRISGMSWMFIGLLVFFLAAAAFTAIVQPIRRGGSPAISVPDKPQAFFGVNSFETADGEIGAIIDNVEPPGSPADKAGLVGGDIVTSFDGHAVKNEDDIRELLADTTIGKMADVTYLRDGEQKTTKLAPISRADFERLEREFANRPGGKGRFGFDDGDTDRVPIPGTKMYGVRLDDISQNLPADMAGIKEGDIVTEFDGVPIRTPQELSARVRRAVPYNTIDVVVVRGTETIKIPVKMGKE